MYNIDEANLSTVPETVHKVLAAKGKRQVGAESSTVRSVTTTGVFCMNAAGCFFPPMVIFKRKRMKDEHKDSAPQGTVFDCNGSALQTICRLKLQT
ncbi:tigger transposable element-derived protein [Plakobranchus ocellatus]|uniref:Tigger transposable element-derived protein n=1 Tax=Plakobranchus ocellatus TaxID=259542 RepID=A0AAV3YDI5_9GAST|nr:tigger transposable element-derived protein [Plakobranchus ocellatus]